MIKNAGTILSTTNLMPHMPAPARVDMSGPFCLIFALALTALFGDTLMAETNASVTALRCEYLTNPLGIDVRRPRLSWIIEAEARGWKQQAYQIVVATSEAKLLPGQADLWDSGKVESDQSIQVAYAGAPVRSRMRCCWKVRVWDNHGEASAWSDTGTWTMGLLEPEDWTAQWIGCDWFKENAGRLPWLRKTFTIDGKPEGAMAFVHAIGYYELYVNGRKVGDDVLSPLVSAYSRRSLYITHDITSYLSSGLNCVSLWLGRGWESRLLAEATGEGPVIRAQFEWQDSAGTTQRLVTDGSWKVHPSPITPIGKGHTGDYGGERYDAGQEVLDWAAANFDDSAWKSASVHTPHTQTFAAQCLESNRVFETIRPSSVGQLEDGSILIDMGRNFSGWLDIRFPSGQAGQEVLLEYADKRFDDGKLQTYGQRDVYIMRGHGEERFRNRFNYHAFRWVKITGLEAKPEPAGILGYMIHTGYESAAAFECSSDLLNRIYDTTVWTYRCLSLGGYVVDCPTRERLGYGGDSGASLETGMTNCDLGAFFTKWLADWRADQADNGDLPHTSPHPGPAGGGPAWGGIVVTLPWQVYVQYGDQRILEQMYPTMRRWLAFLETHVKDGLLQHYVGMGCPASEWNFLGDWVPPGRDQAGNRVDERSTLFFNNCHMAYSLRIAAKTAALLGKHDEAQAYQKRADELAAVLHQRFLNDDGATYANGEQPYLAMPLLFDVTPEPLRARVMASLEHDIRVQCKGHLNTGMHGTYYLLKLLTSTGRNDLAYEIASKETYPSWGYMLKNGATTIWEQWDGDHSHIHNTLVSIGAWFIQGLGGIQYDEQAPGFKHFAIRPGLVGDLTYVRSRYRSMYGPIESNWERRGDKLMLQVSVPANTTATVSIPARQLADVTEQGTPLAQVEGVTEAREQQGQVSFLLGAGRFVFESRLPTE